NPVEPAPSNVIQRTMWKWSADEGQWKYWDGQRGRARPTLSPPTGKPYYNDHGPGTFLSEAEYALQGAAARARRRRRAPALGRGGSATATAPSASAGPTPSDLALAAAAALVTSTVP